jgi:hypothetical protein
MVRPGETEAGSAGMQPCRGIAWRAHRHDDHRARKLPFRALQRSIGEIDPHALKIPARRAESTLTENASSPFPAEPEHSQVRISDLKLATSVEHAVHILSIDDNRNPSFSPLLWQTVPEPRQTLEQIWMPGVHADVGGASEATFIGDVALLTMIDRVKEHCPEVEWDEPQIRERVYDPICHAVQLAITNERTGLKRKILLRGDRHVGAAAYCNQYIHPLTTELEGKTFLVRGKHQVYQPNSCIRSLPEVQIKRKRWQIVKDGIDHVFSRVCRAERV